MPTSETHSYYPTQHSVMVSYGGQEWLEETNVVDHTEMEGLIPLFFLLGSFVYFICVTWSHRSRMGGVKRERMRGVVIHGVKGMNGF